MELTRREFFKLSGGGVGAAALFGATGSIGGFAAAQGTISLHKQWTQEKTTICPYDATGCGFIVRTDADGKLISIEGDPDHPINRGSACSKGASLAQLNTVDGQTNPHRVTKPLYRRAGGTEWEEISWDEAFEGIAAKIKATRDSNWTSSDGGVTVNHTTAIASVGGASLDNEECYFLAKMLRSLGLVYVEHQARI